MGRKRAGFTLIEMLTTVAALVILLGLMVSLARFVRNRSAELLTRDVLGRLETFMSQQPGLTEKLKDVPPLVVGGGVEAAEPEALRDAALENSRAFVKVARTVDRRVFRDLPMSVFDEVTFRDAWGTPVAYMPPGAANIGIAPRERFFFLSAGPDRDFTTLLDNVYSYERAGDYFEEGG